MKYTFRQKERKRFSRMVMQFIPWRLVNLSGGKMSGAALDEACHRVLGRFTEKLEMAGSAGISQSLAAQMLDQFCQDEVGPIGEAEA